jgi:hypothetical protein
VKGLQDRKEGRDRMVQDLEKQLQNEWSTADGECTVMMPI